MQIHQFQASYQPEQDRVLVRVNTFSGEELRFWLTRRLTLRLFPYISQMSKQRLLTSPAATSHDGANACALAEFAKQEVLQRADFNKPFDSHGADLPLGQTPMLTTAVHIAPATGDSYRLKFEERVADGAGTRSIELTLEPPLLVGLLHVLEKVLEQTDWGVVNPASDHPEESSALDLFEAAVPTKYLN